MAQQAKRFEHEEGDLDDFTGEFDPSTREDNPEGSETDSVAVGISTFDAASDSDPFEPELHAPDSDGDDGSDPNHPDVENPDDDDVDWLHTSPGPGSAARAEERRRMMEESDRFFRQIYGDGSGDGGSDDDSSSSEAEDFVP